MVYTCIVLFKILEPPVKPKSSQISLTNKIARQISFSNQKHQNLDIGKKM
jgi:hypothetical protein